MDSGTTAATPAGISRRTLARGAGWAVPAVVVAVAAPAYAASPPAPNCTPSTFDYARAGDGVSPNFTYSGTNLRVEVGEPTTNGTATSVNGKVGHVVEQYANGSTSNLGNALDNNVLLNIAGRSTSSITLRFVEANSSTTPKKPYTVSNLRLRFRDVTNRRDTATGATNATTGTVDSIDSLTFSPAATRYANVTNSNPVVGITSAPAALQRLNGTPGSATSAGYNTGNDTFYDADVFFTGPLTEVTITYTNASAQADVNDRSAVGLYQIAAC